MDITLIKTSVNGNITGAVYYPYNPSEAAAYSFISLFAVTTVAHAIYLVPLRAWFFINFVLGGICETFGYYGRLKCHNDVTATGYWMLQNVLLLGAPTFFAASVYMTLGRFIVNLQAEEYALISPRWITRIYLTIDILCFISQFAGAGIQASGSAMIISIGNKAILGGLIFQLVAFGFFIFMAVCVHRSLNAAHTTYTVASTTWYHARKHFWALYCASTFFMVRNLVRAIEYGQVASGGGFSFAIRNTDGSLHYLTERGARIGDKEVYLYIFDAAMMLGIMLIFIVLHPGRLVKWSRSKNEELLLEVEMRRRA